MNHKRELLRSLWVSIQNKGLGFKGVRPRAQDLELELAFSGS